MLAHNYKFGMMVASSNEGDDASLAPCLSAMKHCLGHIALCTSFTTYIPLKKNKKNRKFQLLKILASTLNKINDTFPST